MGVTSPLQPNDNTLLGDPVDDGIADPEDKGGQFGEDVERFTTFMRALSAPPRLIPTDQKERREIEEGSEVFESTGCAQCHTPEFETLSEGSFVNGRTLRVPKALGDKKFHPYADFLLHDIGTGPAILREGLSADARGKIRTAALWGLGTRQAHASRSFTTAARVRSRKRSISTRTPPPWRQRSFNACLKGSEPGF